MSAIGFFFVPCLSLFIVFWLSFGLVYFALSGRLRRIERRVQRLERPSRNTEDFTPDVVRVSTPRPPQPRRYITVDRQPKY